MIPQPGDFITYKCPSIVRYKVIRVEPAPEHPGRHKVFTHKILDSGRLETDFESWFVFPFSMHYLGVEYMHRETQLDLFGEAA